MTTLPDVSLIPAELMPLSHWVGWRLVQRDGKPTKVPVDPKSGNNADTTDDRTWGDCELATRAVEKFKLNGIGFVFTGAPYTGVDLDDCRDPKTGAIQGWAMKIIKQLDSYTESSPSGRGAHTLVRAKLPPGRRRKGKVEMYDTGRYFAMTGHHIAGTPTSIEDRQTQLEALHEQVFHPVEKNEARNPHAAHVQPVSIDDKALIDRACRAGNGDKFRRLWSGEWQGEYPSQSEADQALCTHLAFWAGKDPDRIDRLFRQSGLMREKWDRDDYRNNTINAACAITTETWTPPSTPRKTRSSPPPAGTVTGPSAANNDAVVRPEIKVNNRQLRDTSSEALDALEAANNPPSLFIRSGELIRIRADENGRQVISRIGESEIRGSLARAANFIRFKPGKDGAPEKISCSPPLDVARDVLALGQWPFPPLEAVVEVPVLRPDGSVVEQPGYDPATRLFYSPAARLNIPVIPRHPTKSDIDQALSVLDDAVSDFPYADSRECEANKANALGLLLSPIVRQAIEGRAPLALIDAPQAGTGKSLLAQVVALIATGRGAAIMTAPLDEESWRKSITAMLTTGATSITIDNVEHPLGSASLAAVLTADTWTDRILGRSEMVVLPQRAVWVATGNNIRLKGDLPRRCYWIRLDAKMSRPWKRSDFRHRDLARWATEQRGPLVAALLTLARAWEAAGRPEGDGPFIGGFEPWCRTVGGILAHVGVNDFLGNLEELYEAADQEGQQWELFLRTWDQEYGSEWVNVADIIARVRDEHAGLRQALPDHLAEALEGKGNLRIRLGRALEKREGVRFGDEQCHLEKRLDSHSKRKEWRVLAGS